MRKTMLIDLKKYFSGEDISQAIDYTVDLSEVEIDGCKPFVTPVQVKGSIRSFAYSAELNVEVRYAYSMPCNRCLTSFVRKTAKGFAPLAAKT